MNIDSIIEGANFRNEKSSRMSEEGCSLSSYDPEENDSYLPKRMSKYVMYDSEDYYSEE